MELAQDLKGRNGKQIRCSFHMATLIDMGEGYDLLLGGEKWKC